MPFSCNTNDYNVYDQNNLGDKSFLDEKPKTAEELRYELLQEENSSPLSYLGFKNVTLEKLKVKTRNAGLFRDAEYADDGARIKGFFTNSATLAKYKDIKVKVSFYSVTKTRISSEGYVIYLYTEPNSVTDFSIKIDEVPQAYHSFGFEIVGATPVE